jgi:hypothetical protein
MAMPADQRPDVETLTAVIARSPIVVERPVALRLLPPGFEAVDAAILGWIAAEARRLGHGVYRM